MLIYIGEISDKYYYGVYNIIKMLFPLSEITRDKDKNADISFEFLIDETVKVYINGDEVSEPVVSDDVSLTLKRCIYTYFKGNLPFGVFTGIRPVKGLKRVGEEAFEKLFFVDKNKVSITKKCLEYEKKVSDSIQKRSVSLYVHIPFCPTRCIYCSFLATKYSKKLVDEYFTALMFELEETLKTLKENDVKINCVYVGGGTPTILDSEMIESLTSKIKSYYPYDFEFTFEAGRADTVTKEKLTAMKNGGVTRISINPQTLKDETLKLIGRNHTKDDFINAYNLACDVGFKNINTDLIAGLPNEELCDFENTLSGILSLNPQSITVHTLCKKRCADMVAVSTTELHKKMLDYAYKKLMGTYEPYYIYRQKNAVGSLENVGFVNDKNVCAYNIIMMEEISSVVAVGAGSASKLVDFESKKPFSKIRNDKQPQRYIAQILEIIEKKRRFLEDGLCKI